MQADENIAYSLHNNNVYFATTAYQNTGYMQKLYHNSE